MWAQMLKFKFKLLFVASRRGKLLWEKSSSVVTQLLLQPRPLARSKRSLNCLLGLLLVYSFVLALGLWVQQENENGRSKERRGREKTRFKLHFVFCYASTHSFIKFSHFLFCLFYIVVAQFCFTKPTVFFYPFVALCNLMLSE